MEFVFSNKSKITFTIFMVIGLIALIFGFGADETAHHSRFWANILINGFFFFGISLGALFFLALQYATEASYMVVLKRVFEAISQYMWVGALVLIIFFFASSMHWNHVYHWMDPAATHEFVIESTMDSAHPEYTNEAVEGAVENHHFDSIIAGKSAYLNIPFFWIRTLAYLGVWLFFVRLFRRRSLLEDQTGGTKIHFKNMVYSALFLVFFAYTSSTASWDWLMSIDTHWFSTLYGWYVFSGIWVSAMITIVLLTIFLKSKGYLEVVNKSHLQDVSKWMFAISFLWSYLWFSQFMLIWYSNIPEEVTYYMTRIDHYKGLFFGVFAINFALPMVVLMSRDCKRSIGYSLVVGIILFIGHWLDVYLLVMPGVVGAHGEGIGFFEIGTFIGFLGLFLFVVFRSLAKAPLVVKNHPYLEESKHLHI